MGRGLLEWLYHYSIDGVGVLGYDPILGSFSPQLRVMIHMAAINFLWAAVIVVAGWAVSTMASGIIAAVAYTALMYFLNYKLPAVSQPGGPRPHKIQRHPDWKAGPIALPKEAYQFVYQQAATAHQTTEARLAGTGAYLSGEPTGRDIWTDSCWMSLTNVRASIPCLARAITVCDADL